MPIAFRLRPGGAWNVTFRATTSLFSIQQPLTEDGVGTLMFDQLRSMVFSTVRFGLGARKPPAGASMPEFMPWISEFRMMISLAE